jgi:Na+/H+ antiporter NhaA
MSHFFAIWLLPIFFCLVGVELRSEIKSGTFKKKRDLLIPFSAALFGVIIPFLIYQIFVLTTSVSRNGWGAVVATDLPLALLALKLLSSDTRNKIRPYLLSLAIFDDLISILLIALVYHQNGIHPTVYGFLIGILLPLKEGNSIVKYLNKFSNFIIIPLFVLSSIFENFTLKIGLMTLSVLVARMAGKPLGVFFGDLLGRKLVRSEILNKKEVLAVGTIAALGLSVSLLFAQITKSGKELYGSIIILIPIALIRIKVLSKTFMKGIS